MYDFGCIVGGVIWETGKGALRERVGSIFHFNQIYDELLHVYLSWIKVLQPLSHASIHRGR
jgi:hypothetical protein